MNDANVSGTEKKNDKDKNSKRKSNKEKPVKKITQVDGTDDIYLEEYDNLVQLDGNSDPIIKTKVTRISKAKRNVQIEMTEDNEDVSPPKRSRDSSQSKPVKSDPVNKTNTNRSKQVKNSRSVNNQTERKIESLDIKSNGDHKKQTTKSQNRRRKQNEGTNTEEKKFNENNKDIPVVPSKRKQSLKDTKLKIPNIVVTSDGIEASTSKYFGNKNNEGNVEVKSLRSNRRRSQTTNNTTTKASEKSNEQQLKNIKSRSKSATETSRVRSEYFEQNKTTEIKSPPRKRSRSNKIEDKSEDEKRVSHRDLSKLKTKPKNDVTGDLIGIIKNRVKVAKAESRKSIVKGKVKMESGEDSDYLPEETKRRNSDSDDDFKPTKISPKPSTSRKIDRRVLSSDEETPSKNKINVWCEVYVEELEQWIAVDVNKGKIHCTKEIYNQATHPVCYAVGWDNNNYLKDLTRRYVPHWNTETRKQRPEPSWWNVAVRPWLAPKTAKDREEDEQLDRLQLEAPLPKSIAEYKNHPLYALKRHLLKFEALYPPDAATLGFVRNEPVYARECVYVCRSRDTWLKEAKVVRLGERPYKVVKARPKWDRLSNKLITDKPLEVFGPWQVQDYEPPVAENGMVPRNPYGNVELFKDCMLPIGTVHIKLPGLNRVAKKLNIDCAPAMTGFDFNGGWSHPVYDGFVVCKEFEEIITDAWVKDQEEQERRETEKMETRVYGNWKRLIKGLLIRERLKAKYGFEEPAPAEDKKKVKAPRLVVKKRN